MHYFVACLLNRIATLLYIVSMTECTNHRPWDIETPSHKISHNEYYEQWGTTDKTKHKPSMLQPRIRHTRITTNFNFFLLVALILYRKNTHEVYDKTKQNKVNKIFLFKTSISRRS